MAQKQICLVSDMGRLIPKIRSTTTSKLSIKKITIVQQTITILQLQTTSFVAIIANKHKLNKTC